MPIRKTLSKKQHLEEAFINYFLTGEGSLDREETKPDAPGSFDLFLLLNPNPNSENKLRSLWLDHRDDIMEIWKSKGLSGVPYGCRFD